MKKVTMYITGTMGSASCVYRLVNTDDYDIRYGGWLEPIEIRDIPRDEAVALGELLLAESDGYIKYKILEA